MGEKCVGDVERFVNGEAPVNAKTKLPQGALTSASPSPGWGMRILISKSIQIIS